MSPGALDAYWTTIFLVERIGLRKGLVPNVKTSSWKDVHRPLVHHQLVLLYNLCLGLYQ